MHTVLYYCGFARLHTAYAPTGMIALTVALVSTMDLSDNMQAKKLPIQSLFPTQMLSLASRAILSHACMCVAGALLNR